MRTSNPCIVAAIVVLCPALTFAGTISGKVTYTGTPVKQKPISMAKEPSCEKQHSTPITTETVVTGANNTLENVVVYIAAGADDAFGETTREFLREGLSNFGHNPHFSTACHFLRNRRFLGVR